MTVATLKAIGTRGERNAASGRVRISFTMPDSVFEDLKASAIRNRRSIAAEIRARVAKDQEEAARCHG